MIRVYPDYGIFQMSFGVEISERFLNFRVDVEIILSREFVSSVYPQSKKLSLSLVGLEEFLHILKVKFNKIALKKTFPADTVRTSSEPK